MKYDISKSKAPEMPNLERGQNAANYCSKRPQKTCLNPCFRCFSLLLAHISATQNFSILTSFGRKCVAKWPIS